MGIAMKIMVMAGILLFVTIGSASAQGHIGGLGAGGGSGLNSGGAINSGSATSKSPVGLDSRPSPNVQATNPGEFVPSTFENYEAAVGMGEEARRARTATVVEAAHVAQQMKAARPTKPTIVLEEDSEGKLMVMETTRVQTKP
jgi:hypothetical protein